MTKEETLNAILETLLNSKKSMSFILVCRNIDTAITNEKIEEYRETLESKKYIISQEYGSKEFMEITQKGKYFIENGGYVKLLNDANIESQIKANQIEKFKIDKKAYRNSKISMCIAGLGILIAATSLYSTMSMKEEQSILKKRVDNMKYEVLHQKTTLKTHDSTLIDIYNKINKK